MQFGSRVTAFVILCLVSLFPFIAAYRLTFFPAGKMLASFSNFEVQEFQVRERLLMDELPISPDTITTTQKSLSPNTSTEKYICKNLDVFGQKSLMELLFESIHFFYIFLSRSLP